MKATFDVSIIADRKYKTVLSNGDVASRTDIAGGDRAITVFHRTPRMSTYLVAFLVSNFEFIEAPLKRSDGTSTRVRVYSTPESLASGELNHSLASALGALHVYESLFEIAFPLPKIDLVAIPDFAAGAMENWGLITFRQTALLASPEHSTASDYRYVSAVVAHELAHQWFGNLVTMEWWSDLWLNEGTYVRAFRDATQYGHCCRSCCLITHLLCPLSQASPPSVSISQWTLSSRPIACSISSASTKSAAHSRPTRS